MTTTIRHLRSLAYAATVFTLCSPPQHALGEPSSASNFSLTGASKKWEAMAIGFQGPSADAAGNNPNPFLDYRLQVLFTAPNGEQFNAPGFFDGDGKGGRAGNMWRVLFSPDEVGQWQFQASFRKGLRLAVSLDANAGEPAAFDGCKGQFTVAPQDKNAPGYLKWGQLEYVGKFYLKFRDGGYPLAVLRAQGGAP